MEDHNVSPFNVLPPVVVALTVVIAGLEVMFQLATAGFLGGQGGVGWAACGDAGLCRAERGRGLDACKRDASRPTSFCGS